MSICRSYRRVLLSLSLLTAVTVVRAQVMPVIQGAPLTGPVSTIKGIGDPGTAANPGKIYVCVKAEVPDPKADCSSDPALLSGQPDNYAKPSDSQEFTANLATPIPVGSFVYLTQVLSTGTQMSKKILQVVAAGAGGAAPAAAAAIKPSILLPAKSSVLTAGQTTLQGIADPSASSKVYICITTSKPGDVPRDCSGDKVGSDPEPTLFNSNPTAQPVPVDATTDTFSVTLNNPLVENSYVYLIQKPTPAVAPAAPAGGVAVVPAAPAGDAAVASPVDKVASAVATYEREQTDFVGGSLLSATGNNYSQASLFLALNYDRTIWRPGWYRQKDTACHPTVGTDAEKAKFVLCAPSRHPGLNTFFQARLTSIPVNASQTTTTSTTTPTMTGTGTTTAAPITSAASFLAAQKAAQFSGGGYIPFLFGKTPSTVPFAKDKTGAFYVAPIARFGFSTPSGDPSGTSSTSGTNGTSGTTTTTTTTTSALGTSATASGQLYNYWFTGFRLASADLLPGSMRTRHYFDIGVGKYSNLQSLTCNIASCLTAAGVVDPTKESRTTLLRLAFEGYLEIPLPATTTSTSSSLILGMSANTNPGAFPHPTHIDIGNKASEDIKFLFGYKFDVSSLIGAFPGIGKN